ncbi:hypothetical protein MW887_002381 [Aspergillus wentii]|nr:hypothetical protein MW887_002381 [Aspergillus wentii]
MTLNNTQKAKIHKVIDEFARAPLEATPIAQKPLSATPETVLAMVLDALLKSRPISHELSQKAVNHIIDVGYHDIEKLSNSSWEERAMVLAEGGYNRYNEKEATNLGELVRLVEGKYDGDLNNLLKNVNRNPSKARQLVKEVKGLGDLGVDIFFNNVQSIWPSMAPSIDARSLKTAAEIGIGGDVDVIYSELKRNPLQMSLADPLLAAQQQQLLDGLRSSPVLPNHLFSFFGLFVPALLLTLTLTLIRRLVCESPLRLTPTPELPFCHVLPRR